MIDNIISIDNQIQRSKLLKCYNSLGQEVMPNTKGLVIYCNEDDSSEKRFNEYEQALNMI